MNISIGAIILLAVVLFLSVSLGTMAGVEGFQEEELIKTMADTQKDLEKKKLEEEKEEAKKTVEAGPPVEQEPALSKQEQELFDQIIDNKIPSNELEKLIRAGVLTENMVEKFLNQVDKHNAEKIEGFCSGDACYAPLR